jgi:hypothetical protein
MDIEKQVVSLELAKQLKEAGYPQNDSLWVWAICDEIMGGPMYRREKRQDEFLLLRRELDNCRTTQELLVAEYAAPTVAELGEALPDALQAKITKTEYELYIQKRPNYWYVIYVFYSGCIKDTTLHYTTAPTEADARAKMWLYLKKEKLL